MRLRSQLLYVLLAMLLVIAFIVEASKGLTKKNEKEKPISTTLIGTPGPGSVAASEDAFGNEFRGAVDGDNFGWLKKNWMRWYERKDLLDYVITKGVVVTVGYIQKVGYAKRSVLAALFDKGEEMVDDVLGRVKYNDEDLWNLTCYRPELLDPPEKFFKVLGKIEALEKQKNSVSMGVTNLFRVEKHDSVVSLVDALGKRTFKGKCLKDVAIQKAFEEGSRRKNQNIVKLYCEHPAIYYAKYIEGVYESWNVGEPSQVFQLLLEQADQRDLEAIKAKYPYRSDRQFTQAIDRAFKTVLPTGSRHLRPIERAVFEVLDSIISASNENSRPGSIISAYILGEQGKTKKSKSGKVQATSAEQ